MQRLILGLLGLLIAIGSYGYNPNASNIHIVGNYVYEVQISSGNENGYASLIAVKPGYEPKGEVTIPGSVTIDGTRYVVNHLGYTYRTDNFFMEDVAFKDFPEITRVNIPSTITDIGNWEFIGCTGINEFHVNAANKNYKDDNGVLFYRWGEDYDWRLFRMPPARPKTKYTIPDDVISIEACAFADQKTLRTLILSERCQLNDELWAWGNHSIKEIDTSNSDWYKSRDGIVFYTWGNDNDIVACPPGLKLDRYVVPADCKTVRGGAFCYTQIPEIVLHDNLEVGSYAFAGAAITELNFNAEIMGSDLRDLCVGCKSLRKVNIKGKPSKQTIIGQYAFSLCDALEEVNIETDNIHIQTGAFYGCTSLHDFPFEKVVSMDGSDIHSYWSGREFENSGLREVVIPPTIETIPADCFRGCTELTDVSINQNGGSNTKIIGGYAFEGCSSLETISLAGVQYVGGWSFVGAPLKQIVIPARSKEEGNIRIGPAFEFLPETRLYIDTPEVEWVSANGTTNFERITIFVSYLDEVKAVPIHWRQLYCPAGMTNWFINGYHPGSSGWGGPVTEMFSLSRSQAESSLILTPNPELEGVTFEITDVEIDGRKATQTDTYAWKADGVRPAYAVDVRISYLVDGVPMSTLYPPYYTEKMEDVVLPGADITAIHTLSGINAGKSPQGLTPGIYIFSYSDGTKRKQIIQ